MIWSPLSRTSSPMTTSMKVTLAPLLLPKHLRRAPASVLSHLLFPLPQMLFLRYRLPDSLTSFNSLLICSLLSKAQADQLFKKFQLSTRHPVPLPIILILLFFPQNICHLLTCFHLLIISFKKNVIVCLLPLEQNHDKGKSLCFVHCHILSR